MFPRSLKRPKCLISMSQRFDPMKITNGLRQISNNSNEFDIIIAGAGMVGSTLACTLGKNKKLSNKSILLLESTKPVNWDVNNVYSKRVSALNPSTYSLLNKIEAWKHIEAGRHAVVKKLQVWDALSDAMVTFSNDDLTDPMAYVVENNLILASVGKELRNTDVRVMHEAKVKSYILPVTADEPVQVLLEDDRTFTANLLIGCDGGNSKVREAMGSNYVSWNYNQTGVVATVHLSEETENVVAWQRFLPSGPIALLPLTSNLSSLVWSTTPDHAKQLVKLSKEQFVDAINEAFWKEYPTEGLVTDATKRFDSLLKMFNLPSNSVRQLPPSIKGFDEKSRAAFPLGFGHSASYVKENVVLAGDAAHKIHPLAGQGVNLGFGDVSSLCEILSEANYSGLKLGSIDCLRRYETERQRHNLPTMLAIDGLQRVYNTSFTPLVLMRSLGLQFTHALSPLKRAIIGQAST